MLRKPVLVLAAILTAFSVSAVKTNFVKKADMKAAQRWVDSVYNSLSERQRIAQLVFPKFIPTQGQNSVETLKKLVEKGEVGGLLFTEGSIEQYAEMTNVAQSMSRVPLLMTFDGEWGLSMRIKDTPRFPYNMSIGAARDGEKLAYEYGREMARECQLLGIHVNFAPVADVNSNAANPVIGYRSFGEDPAAVARLVTAYSRGLEDGGVQAVAKHFPGHGDTDSDSHKTLPTLERTIDQLGSTELIPFNAFTKAGLSGIMMAHLQAKAIDPTGQPMSLSRPAYRLLREKLGFEGLVYTDALGMKGAVAVDGENPAIAALKAGADVLLCSRTPLDDIDRLLAMVNKGEISKKTIENRVKRVLTYKYLLGLSHRPAPIDLKTIRQAINSPEATALNRRISVASVIALKNAGNILPLKNLGERKTAVVSLGAQADNVFSETVRRYTKATPFGSETSPSALKDYNTVIVGVFNDKPATRTALAALKSVKGDLIVVYLVNPYKMAKMSSIIEHAEAVILAGDDTPVMRGVAAEAVFGGIDVTGRLSVTLKGLYDRGAGLDLKKVRLGYSSPLEKGMKPGLTDSIDALMAKAIKAGAFPGAQILIARGGDVVLDKSYGKLTEGGADVTPFTVYDLASVSKAIGTLPGVMAAYDRGLIELDRQVADYVPGLKQSGKDFTVRELLFHETGMPASLNMFNTMLDTATYSGRLLTSAPDSIHPIKIQNKVYGHRDARLRKDIVSDHKTAEFPTEMAEGMFVGQVTVDTIMGRIYNIPLRKDKSYNYSCLNFALAMDAEQRVTGIPHDQWCDSLIWKPLGAWTMGYQPLKRLDRADIAPTENDTYLRRQTMHGYVHDEMADFLGGVSGNAGLFANADDIAKMCQMWLNGGEYGGERIMSPETVKLFTTTKSPNSRRGLGFDKPDMENPKYSPTADEANGSTYGHLGFTGTVFWVDPENDMIVIFLTNRVNPTRDNAAFAGMNIRPEIMRQAILSATR